MTFNKKKKTDNNIIISRESKLYINNDIIYKIFKENINIKERIKIIEIFLNNKINNCPEIYDFIYKNSRIIGYSMKYYPQAVKLSQNVNFNHTKEKCLELIDIYLNLKNNYNICYSDFHDDNILINNKSILLLDIDSCIIKNAKNEIITNKYLCDYILSKIYKTLFFDYEIYFSPDECKEIRNYLYKNINGQKIETIEDLKQFIFIITKKTQKKY